MAADEPVAGLIKEFKGRVRSVDPVKRILTIFDEEDVDHPFKWDERFDAVMKKWKEKYYLAVTFDEDTRLIKTCEYWQEGKDNWHPVQKKGGQGNWQPRKPRITISATVNLQNYENIKVEVEGSTKEECTGILIDTLNGFATNPAYSQTREMIQTYMARVLNVKAGGK